MPVVLRIAFRNIWEHKSKTLIIGILVAIGCIILVLGNAFMDTSAKGIREIFIEYFTGDMMIHGASKDPVSIFGVQSMTMDSDTSIPVISDYDKVLNHVKQDPRVSKATSMSVAYGLLSADIDDVVTISDDNEDMNFGIVFGVDAGTYFDMFPSVKSNLIAGRCLQPGEKAAMLNSKQLEKLSKKYGRDFKVGDKILINGFGTAGMRIREAEIVGIYDLDSSSNSMPFIYTDVDTARVLGGLTLGTDESIEIAPEQQQLLNTSDEDALFSDDAFSDDIISSAPVATSSVDITKPETLLGDVSRRDLLNSSDTGSWNFILVRLQNSADTAHEMASYTSWFADNNIDAEVTDWKGAAGSMGSFTDILRTIFNIALLIISIVAVIIMMNTLVVSVIERTPEIGTMRALGAQRSFIRRMFLSETIMTTLLFGLIGSVISLILIGVLNLLKIQAPNDIFKMLFGGPVLHLSPNPLSFVITILMVFIVGWIAHLFPVSVALKVEPVKAMGTE